MLFSVDNGPYVESFTAKGTKYKCSRDGISEITVALPMADGEAAIEKKPSVHIAVGDRLKCKRAFFIAQTHRRLNCFKVTMMSGRHECNEGIPDVRIYAEIEASFENIVHAAEKRLLEMKRMTEIETDKAQPLLK